jgi:starch synthase
MYIVMVASESNPFVKVGGLGDVVLSLSKAYVKQQHRVSIVIPFYRTLKIPANTIVEYRGTIDVFLSWRKHTVTIKTCMHEGVEFIFMDAPFYFDREGVYGYGDEHERWACFVHAVRHALPFLERKPDIIHVHDWHPGMLPLMIQTFDRGHVSYQKVKFVSTIHSPAFHGDFDPYLISEFYGLPQSLFDNGSLRLKDRASTLKAALVYSDFITTVSSTHAEELLTEEGGFGIDGVLRLYHDKFKGIVNGIDTEEWDSFHDPFIPHTYKLETLREGKRKNKEAFYNQLQLDDVNRPLFGVVTRLTYQKGVDLILDNLEHYVHQGCNFVILGAGEQSLEWRLKSLQGKYPRSIHLALGYHNELAHQIYASSDFFLMPSLFEPCGIAQLIALRYGSLPIVRETGGLKETVKGYNIFGQNATGFSFLHYTGDSLGWAINQAIEVYRQPIVMETLQKNAMRQNYDWAQSSLAYLGLYQNLINK